MVASGPTGAGALRRIRTFAQVFQYLVDVLDWPLETNDFQDEDLTAFTYDWDPGEMGIPADRLRRVWQMRPLTAAQPWGVFFLEFAGSRLPITQVRHVLRVLVTSKRAAASGLPTWRLDDLLFVVLTGDADSVELNLLAFRGSDPRSAEFLPLAWRPEQSPSRHLVRLDEELLPLLRWPDDDSAIESWRAAWRKPFELPIGRPIRDAARLAERMARTARDLRAQLTEALESEEGSGPFSTLMEEIRARLVSDIDGLRFADMCAQTLVYGLLSSRANNREGFGASPIFSTVPLANPFLEAFFGQIHDQAALLDLPGSGLPQLVADLQETNVEGILDQFGSTIRGGDPVIHFYEEFLKLYDRKLRADAGAFYTPQPVVECMVRLVDEVLRSRFGLTLGIADPSSWAEVADRNDFTVPDGVDPDEPFVSMIDPATGTGTFLIQWIRRARQSFTESRSEEDWPQHLRDHVLPSMHAFESMLASYTIAHLKVALELHAIGVSNGKMKILLTDTLDHAGRQGQFDTMSDPVAEEGERATTLKGKSKRFTVVIGNPPYDREQRSVDDISKRKGGVVRYGAPGIKPLIQEIVDISKAAKLGGFRMANLYNDYIYFWRWAVWQATEMPNGPGVVAFITASSYLDGVAMGGMRQFLRNSFDELWILDLGGNSRGALPEENIFDILTPVAIAIGIKYGNYTTDECDIRYLRIHGTRADKLTRLEGIGLNEVSKDIGGEIDFFTPRSDSEYYTWPKVVDIFPWVHPGCKAGRTWPIAETQSVLNRRWTTLLNQIPNNRGPLLKESRYGKKLHSKPQSLLQTRDSRLTSLDKLDLGDRCESIERYGYRSFDRQWIIADNRLLDSPRSDLWNVRVAGQIFLVTLISTNLGHGPVLTLTPYIPDLDHFIGSHGAKNVMPFYTDKHGQTNITHGILDVLIDKLAQDISAEDLLSYVYALGGTSAFSERFANELGERKGPVHIPITTDPLLFKRAVALGRDLLWWHTWGERFASAEQTRIPADQTQQIHPVDEMPDIHSYDSDTQRLSVGTGLFGPVSPDVWNFQVSGLRVVKSWLDYRMKVRKGRKSSPLDNIRPDRWTQTDELLRLLAVLEHTVKVTPTAAQLLEEIVSGPLILANDLPQPTDIQRKPPKLTPG